MPDLAPFLDRDLVLLAAAAMVAGLVRGFAGFGTAMIMVPVASAMWGPSVGIPIVIMLDAVVTLPPTALALTRCDWGEVLPVALGGIVCVPLGVWLLTLADPTALRWLISAVILVVVAVLGRGWRYAGRTPLALRAAVGGTSGLAGGFLGVSGPPVILFWLGGAGAAATVRANIFAFFGLLSVGTISGFALNGLITPQSLIRMALLLPFFAASLWLGTRGFAGAGERQYRGIALGACALAAVLSLPVFDT